MDPHGELEGLLPKELWKARVDEQDTHVLQENSVAALRDTVGRGRIVHGQRAHSALLAEMVHKLFPHVLVPSIPLETLNTLPSSGSQPCRVGGMPTKGTALGPHSFNDSVTALLIHERHGVALASNRLHACRSPDVRVDHIADVTVLGGVAARLQEEMVLDFGECQDFVKINVPVVDGDSGKDILVHQLCDGIWRDATETTA